MKLRLTWLLIATLPMLGCGAPTKPASAVSSLFGQSTSLQAIQTPLCQKLAERTEAPSTKGMVMQIGDCSLAGEGAQNLSQVSSFKFVNIDGSAIDTSAQSTSKSTEVANIRSPNPNDPKVINRAYRAQIWLNKSVFDLAGIFSEFMKKNKGVTAGEVKIPSGPLERLKNLAVQKVSLVRPPVLDIANLSMDASIEMEMSGVAKMYQQIDISGRLIDNSFAVVARSSNGLPYDKSIVHSSEAVIIITPYAGDTYIDFFLSMNLYDFGLRSIVDEQLNSILATILKSALDSFLVVRGDS